MGFGFFRLRRSDGSLYYITKQHADTDLQEHARVVAGGVGFSFFYNPDTSMVYGNDATNTYTTGDTNATELIVWESDDVTEVTRYAYSSLAVTNGTNFWPMYYQNNGSDPNWFLGFGQAGAARDKLIAVKDDFSEGYSYDLKIFTGLGEAVRDLCLSHDKQYLYITAGPVGGTGRLYKIDVQNIQDFATYNDFLAACEWDVDPGDVNGFNPAFVVQIGTIDDIFVGGGSTQVQRRRATDGVVVWQNGGGRAQPLVVPDSNLVIEGATNASRTRNIDNGNQVDFQGFPNSGADSLIPADDFSGTATSEFLLVGAALYEGHRVLTDGQLGELFSNQFGSTVTDDLNAAGDPGGWYYKNQRTDRGLDWSNPSEGPVVLGIQYYGYPRPVITVTDLQDSGRLKVEWSGSYANPPSGSEGVDWNWATPDAVQVARKTTGPIGGRLDPKARIMLYQSGSVLTGFTIDSDGLYNHQPYTYAAYFHFDTGSAVSGSTMYPWPSDIYSRRGEFASTFGKYMNTGSGTPTDQTGPASVEGLSISLSGSAYGADPYEPRGSLVLKWTNPTGSGFSGVVVLRKRQAQHALRTTASLPAVTFTAPSGGVKYAIGENLGGAEIIYAKSPMPKGEEVTLVDKNLTAGYRYYYAVYAHNRSFFYAAGAEAESGVQTY